MHSRANLFCWKGTPLFKSLKRMLQKKMNSFTGAVKFALPGRRDFVQRFSCVRGSHEGPEKHIFLFFFLRYNRPLEEFNHVANNHVVPLSIKPDWFTDAGHVLGTNAGNITDHSLSHLLLRWSLNDLRLHSVWIKTAKCKINTAFESHLNILQC